MKIEGLIFLGSAMTGSTSKPPRLRSVRIDWELKVISAHRQPDALHAYVRAADAGGTQVFIAAAGLSAALPGVIGSLSQRPVIGLPIPGGALSGIDALLSMVQMPDPGGHGGVGSNGRRTPRSRRQMVASRPAVAEKLRTGGLPG
jgi:5-(carboxyamino)imidazole ribonucleotide mutase